MSNFFVSTTETFRWKIRKHKKQVVNFCSHLMMCGTLGLGLMVAASGGALANPEGGNVVAGSATITNTATELQINQSSDRALIEWSNFSINAGETTRFIQPSSSAIAINRVINSNQISSINGNLIANGNVVIINPNGVLIGADGNIDTNSFLATSADIDNDAFMNSTGALDFNRAGNIDAVVENRGSISVAAEGLAALVAPTVRNSGVIQGNLAKVQLAAADTFAVDFYGDGLISYAVEGGSQERTITSENDGEIFADGGAVLMTAADASDVVDSVINNEGVIQAASLERRGGKIVLTGGGAKVKVSGKLDTSGQGDSDGGEILVGGDYQGQGDAVTSENVFVSGTAELYADAGENGDGGKIIVWADNTAVTRGSYYARGGSESGNGGFVETSGKLILDAFGTTVNTLAENGEAGLWLLDPANITVGSSGVVYDPFIHGNDATPGTVTIDASSINSATSNVTLAASDDITFNGDLNIAISGIGLTATAGDNITVNAGGTIRTNGGNIYFDAGNNITINNSSTLYSQGGNIDLIAGNTIGINSSLIGTDGGYVNIVGPTTVAINFTSIDTTGGSNPGGIHIFDPNTNGTNFDTYYTTLKQGDYETTAETGENGGIVTITTNDSNNDYKHPQNCFSAGGVTCFVADPIVATDLTVTIDSFSKIYGVLDPLFTWGITTGSLTGSDSLSVDLARILQNTLAGEQVGNYEIFDNSHVVTGSGLYNITFVHGNLEIIPASVVISAINQNKIYGDTTIFDETNPGDYTIAGLVTNVNGFATGDTITNVDLSSAGAPATADVGVYTINASNAAGTNLSNYAITYNTGALEVFKRALNLDVDDKSMTYGGAAPTLTASYTGFVNGDTLADIDTQSSLTSITPFTADAGTYTNTLIATGGIDNNYYFVKTNGDLTINKADLTVTALNDSKIYDSLAYSGGNGVTYAGFVNGDNSGDLGGALGYAGSAQGATNVGSYDIAANGYTSTNYNISYVDGVLNITPAALTITANNDTKVYDATAYTGGNGVTYTGFVGGETDAVLTGTIGYSGNSQGATNVGNYTIGASGQTSNNYTISYVNGALSITPAALAITANNQTKTYGDTFTFTGNEFTTAGLVGGETLTSATLSSLGSVNTATVAGSTYDIDISNATGGTADLNNYSVTYNKGQMTVDPKALAITANNQAKTYGDTFTFTGNEFITSGLVNGETLTMAALTSAGAPPTANVGGYDINISNATGGTADLNNYAVTYNKGTMTVSAAALLLVAADNQTKTYGDTFTFNGTEFTPTGLLNTDTVTGATITSAAGVNTANAGSYSINISNAVGTGLSNYNISYQPGTFTVNKALLTATADNKTMTYGGPSPLLTATYTGFVNGENTGVIDTLASLSSGTPFNSDAGVYTDTLTASGAADNNYSFSYVAGDLTINKASLLGLTNADSKIYDGLAYSGGNGVTYLGFVNGDDASDLNGSLNYIGNSQGATNVGIYALAGGGQTSNNYNILYLSNSLQITPAALTVTADNQTKTYGDTFTFTGNEFSTSGLVNGETLTSASLSSLGAVNTASVAGSDYDIDISNAGGGTANLSNYTVTYNKGAMTVNPADLTVTADNQTKTYGDTFTFAGTEFTTSGLVNGETLTNATLGSLGSVNTASVAGSDYDIDVSNATGGTADLNNYNVTYTKGAMTVNPAALTVTANNDSKTYDSVAYSGGNGVTYTGFVNGETDAVLGGAVAYGGSSQGAVNVNGSPYVINASGLTSSNYTISYVDGQLVITPRKLFVDPDDQMKIYGDADPALTFQAFGLVGGDTIGSVFTGSLDRTGGEDVGFYGINRGTLSVVNNNYVYGFGKADLQIKPAELLIIANDDSKIFDGVPYSGGNGLTYSGFKFNDDQSVVFGTINFGGNSQGATDIGSYDISPFGKVGARNYRITFVDGTLDISPAPLSFFEIDPLGRPIISVANQAIVLDQPFEEIETLEILTDVGIAGSGTSPSTLAGLEPAAGEGAQTAEEVAGIEPAAGGDENDNAQEGDEFSNDIKCANDFLDNKECDVQDI